MRALLLALLLLFAGCTAPISPGESPTVSPTPETPETPTPVSFDAPDGTCAAIELPTVDADEYDTKAYPSPPESRSNDSVKAYVESFERSYLFNEDVSNRTVYIEVYVTVNSVRQYGDAYVVRLSSYTNGGYEHSEGEGTPYTVHWDGGPTEIAYLVAEDRLLRTEGDYQSPPRTSQLDRGTTMACF